MSSGGRASASARTRRHVSDEALPGSLQEVEHLDVGRFRPAPWVGHLEGPIATERAEQHNLLASFLVGCEAAEIAHVRMVHRHDEVEPVEVGGRELPSADARW